MGGDFPRPSVRSCPDSRYPASALADSPADRIKRGRGLGTLLLACAVDRCLKARQQIAAYALIVDAKGDVAKAFYMHFGFRPLLDAQMTLYLPLGR